MTQLPPFDDYSMTQRTYRYFTGDPLYPFGFGLSYSTFQYSDLRAERTATGAHVTTRVKNTSTRDGDEVVQLYVRGGGLANDPVRELKGFQRVHLNAGEARDVSPREARGRRRTEARRRTSEEARPGARAREVRRLAPVLRCREADGRTAPSRDRRLRHALP